MAVAGDSVGGCMTAALALMAKERGDVRFLHQSLYYPVTDAGMETGSYEQFAEGYHLTAKAMAWFWDAYCPDLARRAGDRSPRRCRRATRSCATCRRRCCWSTRPTCCATRARRTRRKLRAAGVAVTTVRYDGIVHDFMMLNPLARTHATRAAIAQATAVLREVLHR